MIENNLCQHEASVKTALQIKLNESLDFVLTMDCVVPVHRW